MTQEDAPKDGATPAPWTLEQDEDYGTYFIWGEGNMIAKIPERDDSRDWANGKLIVQAVNAWDSPELLRERIKELEK